MPEPVNALMLQFLDWLAKEPRNYAQAMESWRTSCPRLTIWEDALAAGLIQIKAGTSMQQAEVALTPRGKEMLRQNVAIRNVPR
jgi:hypothetical protein